MKIYTEIFKDAISPEAVFAAWDEFKRGKRKKPDVQNFERYLEDNLLDLHDELISKTYSHNSYTAFYVKDPKIRRIHKATVRDRIVHHLVYTMLNPIFEPTFIPDSFSCRIDKGTHRGVQKLSTYARKIYQTHGKCFVLKCDIQKFFDTVDHEILFSLIQRKVQDEDALWLIREIIESYTTPDSRERERERVNDESRRVGIPIGNLTSQIFANIYMNELDQFVKHQLHMKHYLRYTDDFILLHHKPEMLKDALVQIQQFLVSRLKLRMHSRKVTLKKFSQGADFLGYVVFPHVQIVRTKTRRRIMKKLEERMREFQSGHISEDTVVQSINSYMGVLSHAQSYTLQREINHLLWSSLRPYI